MIEIYHSSWKINGIDFTVEDILREGLKSKAELMKERLWFGKAPVNDFQEWRAHCIYFGLQEPKSEIWFSILVDPSITFVGNQELEYSYESYRSSIMTLAEFLEKQKADGKFMHPLTGERLKSPVRIEVEDSLGINITRISLNYIEEIFLEEDIIPGNRIRRYRISP